MFTGKKYFLLLIRFASKRIRIGISVIMHTQSTAAVMAAPMQKSARPGTPIVYPRPKAKILHLRARPGGGEKAVCVCAHEACIVTT